MDATCFERLQESGLLRGLAPSHTCWNFAVSIWQCLRCGLGSTASSIRLQESGPGSAAPTATA
eukprot:2705728-Amphidinium_carterae.1